MRGDLRFTLLALALVSLAGPVLADDQQPIVVDRVPQHQEEPAPPLPPIEGGNTARDKADIAPIEDEKTGKLICPEGSAQAVDPDWARASWL